MAAVSSTRRTTHLLLLLFCLFYLLSIHIVPHAIALSFDYDFSDRTTFKQADLELESDATFHSSWIELTNVGGVANSLGRVSYTHPVPLWDNATGENASFTTNFSFVIRATNNSFRGDGMAFFLEPYGLSAPPYSTGGFLGIFTNTTNTSMSGQVQNTVAVELDTHRNTWDPNDTDDHIGIDVNSITSMTYAPLPNDSLDGSMTTWVEYNHSTSMLAVTLRFNDHPTWNLYSLSARVDLKNSSLPQEVAVGISAATGMHSEAHQLLSWSFSSTLEPKKPPVPPAMMPSSSSTMVVVGVAAGLALFVLLCTIAGLLLWRRWTRETPQEAEFERGTSGPRRYRYRELAHATNNFAEQKKLGRGGFGPVYRGYLSDQDRHMAIKMFSPESSEQGRKEFEAEVKITSRLRHRNLVQLVGWCDSRKGLLLVYELVPGGSLDKHLYYTARLLTWPERYKIMLGLGSALLYLHVECEQRVVHGDIKPSNIMLDSSYNAKLGDFGLARLIDHGTRLQTTRVVAGTIGYIDPEFVNTCKPCTESDVYSIGIVLLEIACGRRPVVEGDETSILLKWVRDLYGRKEILQAADGRLNGEFDEWEMERMLVVGLWCSHPDQSERPSIVQAMSVLQSKDAKLPILPPKLPILAVEQQACSALSIETSNGVHSSTLHWIS